MYKNLDNNLILQGSKISEMNSAKLHWRITMKNICVASSDQAYGLDNQCLDPGFLMKIKKINKRYQQNIQKQYWPKKAWIQQ